MPKIANTTLGWVRSDSPGIIGQSVLLTVNGVESTLAVNHDSVSVSVQVPIPSTVSYKVLTTNLDSLESVSEPHSFSLGEPSPATGLFHSVVAVSEVP